MKIELELRINEDGRQFLNYWDFKAGDDVCCQIIDGKLLKSEYNENGDELPDKEIALPEFVELVRNSVKA